MNEPQCLGSCLECYNNADADTRQAMAAAVEVGYAPMQEVEAQVATIEDFDDMPELVDNFGEDL
jgi:S-adenosylmethionine synthetase